VSKEKVDTEIAMSEIADRVTMIDIINIVYLTLITTGVANVVVVDE
jgi:hypothetical protein